MLRRLWLIALCLLLVVALVGEPRLPTLSARFGRYTRVTLSSELALPWSLALEWSYE